MAKIKKIILCAVVYIIAFALYAALGVSAVCLCVKSSWLNPEFTIARLELCGYFDSLHEDILDDYESIGIPSGLPREVFEQTVDIGMVRRDCEKSVESLYGGQGFSVDTVALRERLKSEFIRYAESAGFDANEDEVMESLAYVENYCVSKYNEAVQFPFSDMLSPYIVKAVRIADMALIICFAIALFCVWGLVFMRRTDAVRHIGSALIGCGLFCVIPCTAMLISAPYKLFNLGNESFYRFVAGLIESGIMLIMITGIGFFVVGIGIVLFCSLTFNKTFTVT